MPFDPKSDQYLFDNANMAVAFGIRQNYDEPQRVSFVKIW